MRQAKIRWRVGHDNRELKTALGIDRFDGRSFVGWHRHVILTVLAADTFDISLNAMT
jgi:SRSO17 transposase